MNTESIKIHFSGEITIETKTLVDLLLGLQPHPKATVVYSKETMPDIPRPIVQSQLVYNVEETAKILGVHQKTVYRLIERRLLRSVSAIRHKRIRGAEIERFLRENVT